MPNPNPIYVPKPFSLQHLRSVFAVSGPTKLAALASLMPWDYFYKQWDFHEPTLTTDWTTDVTAGGVPTAFAYNAQRNAALRGATGTTDNGVTSLKYHSAAFDSADKPMVWIRFVSPAAVTGFSFEIGFSDPKTDEALPAVTDVDTPTIGNGATDLGVVHMDTDQTLTTAALVADGTTGAALKTDISPVWTPTASRLIDVIVGIQANLTFCWIWDNLGPIGVMHAVAQGPDTGVLVRPYALFRTRDITSKTIDILKAVIVAEENRTT